MAKGLPLYYREKDFAFSTIHTVYVCRNLTNCYCRLHLSINPLRRFDFPIFLSLYCSKLFLLNLFHKKQYKSSALIRIKKRRDGNCINNNSKTFLLQDKKSYLCISVIVMLFYNIYNTFCIKVLF